MRKVIIGITQNEEKFWVESHQFVRRYICSGDSFTEVCENVFNKIKADNGNKSVDYVFQITTDTEECLNLEHLNRLNILIDNLKNAKEIKWGYIIDSELSSRYQLEVLLAG